MTTSPGEKDIPSRHTQRHSCGLSLAHAGRGGSSSCVAVAAWLERQRVSGTNPTATLEGPGEQRFLAGLSSRTSLAWFSSLGMGSEKQRQPYIGRVEDIHIHQTLGTHSVLVPRAAQ